MAKPAIPARPATALAASLSAAPVKVAMGAAVVAEPDHEAQVLEAPTAPAAPPVGLAAPPVTAPVAEPQPPAPPPTAPVAVELQLVEVLVQTGTEMVNGPPSVMVMVVAVVTV